VGERRYVVVTTRNKRARTPRIDPRIVEALRVALKQGDKALVGNKGFRKYSAHGRQAL